MNDLIGALIVAAIVIALGIVNMTGNISTLHRYHRNRVAPEDIKPFGKLIGLGTVLCGVGIAVYAPLAYLADKNGLSALGTVGYVVLGVFLVVGIAIALFAIKKYNHGIF